MIHREMQYDWSLCWRKKGEGKNPLPETDRSFIADIHEVAGAYVVRASGPVNGGTLNRGLSGSGSPTHHITDFPVAGYWNENLGLFVVPAEQVTIIDDSNRHKFF